MTKLKQQRDYFGEALVELGKSNPKVLALTADLEPSLRLTSFEEKFPKRFFNVGVAEQNLIGVAVGLSLENRYCVFRSSPVPPGLGRCDGLAGAVAVVMPTPLPRKSSG